MSEESIASEVLAASLGGAVSASVLYPLEVLKTKMQAETKSTTSPKATEEDDGFAEEFEPDDDDDDEQEVVDRSQLTMVQYANHLYKEQGMKVFFQGFETSAFQSAVEKALYFFAYTGLKGIYRSIRGNPQVSTMASLVLGCMAEWAHLPITLPLDCWTTAIQTDTTGKGPVELLLVMLSEKGMKGMYKGIQAYTLLCLKPALQYTVFEQVKAAVVANRPQKKLQAAESFVLGMIARTISTVCIFPYLRAKVVLQSSASQQKSSIPQMLGEMYQQGGFSAWFQGLGPELTRGVLSSALMLMIKDQLSGLVHAALNNHTNPRLTATRRRRRR